MQVQHADHPSVAIDGRHVAQVAPAHRCNGMEQVVVLAYRQHRSAHDIFHLGSAGCVVGKLARNVLLGNDSLDTTVSSADHGGRGRMLAHQTHELVTARVGLHKRRWPVHVIPDHFAECNGARWSARSARRDCRPRHL
jgi:hypothetical protein